MSVLTNPGNIALANDYEQLFQQPQTRLFPITQSILREAAQLRATINLRTPDAMHAATARLGKVALFISNDVGFRKVPNLSVLILDDLLIP